MRTKIGGACLSVYIPSILSSAVTPGDDTAWRWRDKWLFERELTKHTAREPPLLTHKLDTDPRSRSPVFPAFSLAAITSKVLLYHSAAGGGKGGKGRWQNEKSWPVSLRRAEVSIHFQISGQHMSTVTQVAQPHSVYIRLCPFDTIHQCQYIDRAKRKNRGETQNTIH